MGMALCHLSGVNSEPANLPAPPEPPERTDRAPLTARQPRGEPTPEATPVLRRDGTTVPLTICVWLHSEKVDLGEGRIAVFEGRGGSTSEWLPWPTAGPGECGVVEAPVGTSLLVLPAYLTETGGAGIRLDVARRRQLDLVRVPMCDVLVHLVDTAGVPLAGWSLWFAADLDDDHVKSFPVGRRTDAEGRVTASVPCGPGWSVRFEDEHHRPLNHDRFEPRSGPSELVAVAEVEPPASFRLRLLSPEGEEQAGSTIVDSRVRLVPPGGLVVESATSLEVRAPGFLTRRARVRGLATAPLDAGGLPILAVTLERAVRIQVEAPGALAGRVARVSCAAEDVVRNDRCAAPSPGLWLCECAPSDDRLAIGMTDLDLMWSMPIRGSTMRLPDLPSDGFWLEVDDCGTAADDYVAARDAELPWGNVFLDAHLWESGRRLVRAVAGRTVEVTCHHAQQVQWVDGERVHRDVEGAWSTRFVVGTVDVVRIGE